MGCQAGFRVGASARVVGDEAERNLPWRRKPCTPISNPIAKFHIAVRSDAASLY